MSETTTANTAEMLVMYVLPVLAVACVALLVFTLRLSKRVESQAEQIALLEAKLMKEE